MSRKLYIPTPEEEKAEIRAEVEWLAENQPDKYEDMYGDHPRNRKRQWLNLWPW